MKNEEQNLEIDLDEELAFLYLGYLEAYNLHNKKHNYRFYINVGSTPDLELKFDMIMAHKFNFIKRLYYIYIKGYIRYLV